MVKRCRSPRTLPRQAMAAAVVVAPYWRSHGECGLNGVTTASEGATTWDGGDRLASKCPTQHPPDATVRALRAYSHCSRCWTRAGRRRTTSSR